MYRASIENKGDSKSYATTRNYHFVIDTEGEGAHPVDTLLASLCACLGHYARDYFREQKIPYKGFTITAHSHPTEDQMRLSDIDVSIDLQDMPLEEQQQAELLKCAEHCKVYNSLKANSHINISLMSAKEMVHDVSPSR